MKNKAANESTTAPVNNDRIIYTRQTNVTHDHGRIVEASYEKITSAPDSMTAICDKLVPLVVNVEEARANALQKLDALDKLVLGL